MIINIENCLLQIWFLFYQAVHWIIIDYGRNNSFAVLCIISCKPYSYRYRLSLYIDIVIDIIFLVVISLMILLILSVSFWAATKQLYERSCPSICLSTFHTFSTMFLSLYHHEMLSNCHWQKWCPRERSTSVAKGQGFISQNNFSPIWVIPDSDPSLDSQMATK